MAEISLVDILSQMDDEDLLDALTELEEECQGRGLQVWISLSPEDLMANASQELGMVMQGEL